MMRIILKYSFIVLFCLLLVKQFSFAFSFNNSIFNKNEGEPNIFQTNNFLKSEFNELSFPFDCSIFERETIDENETEENNDDDSFLSLLTNKENEFIKKNSLKSEIFELTSSTQNRNRISLIILYQSWKCYLS